jgi:hypothetical protein
MNGMNRALYVHCYGRFSFVIEVRSQNENMHSKLGVFKVVLILLLIWSLIGIG